MAPTGEIIKEVTYKERKCVEWKIFDVQTLTQQNCSSHRSSTFTFLGRRWHLRMQISNSQGGWISMYLALENISSSLPVSLTLGLSHLETQLLVQRTVSYTFGSLKPGVGFFKFFARRAIEELCRDTSKVDLTVHCYLDGSSIDEFVPDEAAFVADATVQTSSYSSTALCQDYQHFLDNGRHSDVTIQVCGQQFRAHKLVLEACSPVFTAMFEHDFSENRNSTVNIDDCDPDVFQCFLQCMYSGKMENLLPENVVNLYTFADKYCIMDMKKACAQLMTTELSVDNVCHIIVLADRCNDTELKKEAEEFLVQNVKLVLPTNQWKTFAFENWPMSVEILMKVVPDNSS